MSTDPMPSSSAVHTTDCILHPAARIDFEQHVRLLWEAGRKDEAETLWNSVVEVQHQPAPRAPILHGTDLPAMAAVPCTEPECERCANRRGGFRFPWIGNLVQKRGARPTWCAATNGLDALVAVDRSPGPSAASDAWKWPFSCEPCSGGMDQSCCQGVAEAWMCYS